MDTSPFGGENDRRATIRLQDRRERAERVVTAECRRFQEAFMTIAGLIERLEKATGSDRELDRLIHFQLAAPWVGKKCVDWVPAAFEGPNDFLWWTAERKAEG